MFHARATCLACVRAPACNIVPEPKRAKFRRQKLFTGFFISSAMTFTRCRRCRQPNTVQTPAQVVAALQMGDKGKDPKGCQIPPKNRTQNKGGGEALVACAFGACYGRGGGARAGGSGRAHGQPRGDSSSGVCTPAGHGPRNCLGEGWKIGGAEGRGARVAWVVMAKMAGHPYSARRQRSTHIILY